MFYDLHLVSSHSFIIPFFFPDMVKFPLKSNAAMFVQMTYDTASVESHDIQASSFGDCVIYCHEDPCCVTVIYGGQPDIHGNNCYLFQKRRADW